MPPATGGGGGAAPSEKERIARAHKDQNKAKVGNHNRRDGAAKKASKGMF